MATPRVLLVSGDFPPFVSGVGDYVDKLAGSLHDAGADVTVLTSASVDPADCGRPFRVLRTIEGNLPAYPGPCLSNAAEDLGMHLASADYCPDEPAGAQVQ